MNPTISSAGKSWPNRIGSCAIRRLLGWELTRFIPVRQVSDLAVKGKMPRTSRSEGSGTWPPSALESLAAKTWVAGANVVCAHLARNQFRAAR